MPALEVADIFRHHSEAYRHAHAGHLGRTERRIIGAIEALKRPCKATVHTDSQYVQKGISEWIHGWKKKNWMTAAKTPVKNADLWKRLDELAALHQIEWRWVKGHAGHPENERADALANRGVSALAEG